jgi:hypothetical protein
VLETPWYRPPEAETPLCASQKALTTFNRPANGTRSAGALTDSSWRRPIGPKTATDKNLLIELMITNLKLRTVSQKWKWIRRFEYRRVTIQTLL